MEMIDRYLHAVKFWLPKEQAEDIIAELSEDIQAQVEERESALGRQLNRDEIAALLRERGRPVLVANRYLPQEHLIGPVLFPIYRFVLKIVGLCYLVPWLLVWVGLIARGAIHDRTAHGWVQTFASMWGSFWVTAWISVGVVTLVFAVLERAEAKSQFLANWDPNKLPAVRNRKLIARTSSGIELAVNLVFVVWWATNLSSLIVLDRPFARVVLNPWWIYFFWAFLALAIANAAFACANLMRPYWTPLRAGVKFTLDGVGAILFCWLLKANIVAAVVLPDGSPGSAHELAATINLWAFRVLPGAIVVGVIIATINAFRIVCLTDWRRARASGAMAVLS
jgi:hypothetical protein